MNIRKIIRETVNETLTGQKKNYYKLTERLLYAYPCLLDAVIDIAKDIKDMITEGDTCRSKDIVAMPTPNEGLKRDRCDILADKIIARQDMLTEIRIDVLNIESALNKLDYEEMKIINYRYFEEMSLKDIAEKMNMHERTVRRKRSKAIKIIRIHIFGSRGMI